MDARLKHYAFC